MRTKRGRFSTAPFYGEDKTLGKRILGWFRRDAVLTVSLCLAVLSCLIEPPGPGYLNYIDFNTLITLFCLMLLVEGLREEQFLQYVAARVLSRAGSVRGLMVTLVFLCFVGSMLITNDVALITFVPLGMMMLEMASQRKRLCFAVALMTVAANLGSMFTPIGNPQNLYLFSLSGLSLPEFLGLTAPYTAGAALLLLLCVRFGCGYGTLSICLGEATPLRRGPVCFYLALFLLCVAAVGGMVPHVALLAVVTVLLLWKDRRLFARIDYSLLCTFVFFFIFVGNIKQLEGLQVWIRRALDGRDRLFGVVLSQVISNVPAAMLLSGYSSDLRELIIGVDLGGLGTLIASMASLISYKQLVEQAPELRGLYLKLFTLLNLGFLAVLLLI